MNNDNLNAEQYKEVEELIFSKHPPSYRLNIQSDRETHKDSRLLQQHAEAIELEMTQREKKIVSVVESMISKALELHSNLPPNPIDQSVPHGIDLDWN